MLESNGCQLSIYTLNQLNCVLKPNHPQTKPKNQPNTHIQLVFETVNRNNIYNKQLLSDTMNHHSENKIIQSMITTCVRMNVDISTIDYVFGVIVNNAILLARNKFGCYVVQCCITDSSNDTIDIKYHEIKLSVFKSIFSSFSQICNCTRETSC